MTAITFIVTNAGMAMLPAEGGVSAVTLSHYGISQTAFAASAATTVIPNELKRLATLSGAATGTSTITLSLMDDSADVYDMRSVGIYASNGTLFAVYSQAAPITSKASASNIMVTLDIAFARVNVTQLNFGNANFLLPSATTDREGLVELATSAETNTGTDTIRAVTPKGMRDTLTSAYVIARIGYTPLNQTAYTAADVRAKLLTVDGSGSGVDADLLDGQQGSYYANIPERLGYTPIRQGTGIGQTNHTVHIGWSDLAAIKITVDSVDQGYVIMDKHFSSSAVLSKLLMVDGSGSGVDADLLDGLHASQLVRGDGFPNSPRSAGIYLLGHTPTNAFGSAPLQLREVNSVGATNTTPAYSPSLCFHWSGVTAAQIRMRANGSFHFHSQTDDENAYRPIYASTYYATAAGLEVMHQGNDGEGSGYDADLLDGQHGGYYANIPARLGYAPVNRAGDTMSGALNINASTDPLVCSRASELTATGVTIAGRRARGTLLAPSQVLHGDLLLGIYSGGHTGTTYSAYSGVAAFYAIEDFTSSGIGTRFVVQTASNGSIGRTERFSISHIEASFTVPIIRSGNVVWDAGNDGAGSGLDADLLDGNQGSFYTNIVARLGYTPLNQTTYTAADIRTKLLTVDGSGSGVDADLLDGQEGTYYANIPARLGYTPLNQTAYTAADVRAKILTVDGSGSGIDADLIRGLAPDAFALMSAFGGTVEETGEYRLPFGLIVKWGYTPVLPADSAAFYDLPTPFPNAFFGIFLQPSATPGAGSGVNQMYSMGAHPVNLGSYRAANDDVANRAFYIALGK